MKRMMIRVTMVVLLAAGGAARAAEKEAPIDWPARAATVKVGMTRAEVEKILPRWEPPRDLAKREPQTIRWSGPTVIRLSQMRIGSDEYQVAEDWRVLAFYYSNVLDDPQKLRLTHLRLNKITRPSDDLKVCQAKAASIKVGMTRAEAERILPAWAFIQYSYVPKPEGSHEVYWFAEDWPRRIRGSGGVWTVAIDYRKAASLVRSEEDRVIKPVKIEMFEKPYPQIPYPSGLMPGERPRH